MEPDFVISKLNRLFTSVSVRYPLPSLSIILKILLATSNLSNAIRLSFWGIYTLLVTGAGAGAGARTGGGAC